MPDIAITVSDMEKETVGDFLVHGTTNTMAKPAKIMALRSILWINYFKSINPNYD
ncbi:hypothetical protein GCM10011506_38530 [Marivirga lumbricoides]|uniref:Uncharacterized protein n=1 Tax=Marivirga lumbricoides TaxID=1046115 RepID=A0ABQ1N1Q8_9BACT|nr:hypothetical protein GCM10011506_38530 [Marivirga lumbricoides]